MDKLVDTSGERWSLTAYTDNGGRTYVRAYRNVWDSVKKRSRTAAKLQIGRLAEDRSIKLAERALASFPELAKSKTWYWGERALLTPAQFRRAFPAAGDAPCDWSRRSVAYGLDVAVRHAADASGLTKLAGVDADTILALATLALSGESIASAADFNRAIASVHATGASPVTEEDWAQINERLTVKRASELLAALTPGAPERLYALSRPTLLPESESGKKVKGERLGFDDLLVWTLKGAPVRLTRIAANDEREETLEALAARGQALLVAKNLENAQEGQSPYSLEVSTLKGDVQKALRRNVEVLSESPTADAAGLVRALTLAHGPGFLHLLRNDLENRNARQSLKAGVERAMQLKVQKAAGREEAALDEDDVKGYVKYLEKIKNPVTGETLWQIDGPRYAERAECLAARAIVSDTLGNVKDALSEHEKRAALEADFMRANGNAALFGQAIAWFLKAHWLRTLKGRDREVKLAKALDALAREEALKHPKSAVWLPCEPTPEARKAFADLGLGTPPKVVRRG